MCTAALVPGGRDVPATCTVPVDRQISGTHDLYFVFLGEGYELYEWRFVPAYRNVFVEFGKSPAQVEKRLGEIRDTFFFGKEDERVYYEAGDDMAYIMDTGNNDARTEGMSYGMMLCVQLDMHEEFDRIWKWAKTYMWMPDGENGDILPGHAPRMEHATRTVLRRTGKNFCDGAVFCGAPMGGWRKHFQLFPRGEGASARMSPQGGKRQTRRADMEQGESPDFVCSRSRFH